MYRCRIAVAGLLLAALSSPAWATPPIPRSSRPAGGAGGGSAAPRNIPFRPGNGGQTTSPYLNLANGQGGLAYFTLVRPQLEQRRQLAVQAGELGALSRRLRATDDELRGLMRPSMRETGHRASFLNYSHFYSSDGGGLFPSR